MVGAQSGLGYLIIDARNSLRSDLVLAGIIFIGALGLLLDRLIKLVETGIEKQWGISRRGEADMYISIEGVSREYFFKGKRTVSLENVNLEIEKANLLPPGTQRMRKVNIAQPDCRFDRPTAGTVKVNGEVVTKPSTDRITLFQNYGLLPWRNVLRNVELGLESKNIDKKKRRQIAEEYIELVGLSAYKSIIRPAFWRNAAKGGPGEGFGSGPGDTSYG